MKTLFISSKIKPHSPKLGGVLAWFIWFISVAFVDFQFFLQISSGVMVDKLMTSFSMSAFGAGILASIYYYIYVLLQTPAGALMDRFGPRFLLTVGGFVCTFGCFLFGFAKMLWIAQVGRLFMGAGSAFAFVGSMYLVREWFPKNRFAFMVGVTETLGLITTIFGMIFMAVLIHQFGWRVFMWGSGILGLVLSFACWKYIKDKPTQTNDQIYEPSDHIPFKKRIMTILRTPLSWFNGIYCGLMFGIISVFGSLWSIPFIIETTHCSLTVATAATTMILVGAAIATPIIGYITGNYGKRRLILVSFGLLSTLVFMIILLVPLSIVSLFILLFLLGIGCSSYALNFAIAEEIAPSYAKSTSIGFTNALCVISAPLFQPLVGFLLESSSKSNGIHLAEYQIALSILPIMTLIAAWIATKLPEKGWIAKNENEFDSDSVLES
ncbi:MAG: MFS transporter [Proteobacteria bacterium]|nr:MFS transporter [Pseudomonadota bacterium]